MKNLLILLLLLLFFVENSVSSRLRCLWKSGRYDFCTRELLPPSEEKAKAICEAYYKHETICKYKDGLIKAKKNCNKLLADKKWKTSAYWNRRCEPLISLSAFHGIHIDQADGSGRTPLGLACGGPADLVEILLERGASLERVDHSGLRPLDRAIGQRNVPVVNCFLRKGAKLGPTTWVMASGKPEFMLILLNKLLEDGNMLYRKNRPSEAAHRYNYALKKINPLISDEGVTTPSTQPVPHEHVSAFVQLKTNLLLNLSRCKRKLNEPSEALDLAARASALRPNAFECAYAMARAILALNKPSEALPHARRALLLAPQNDMSAIRTLKSLQQEILTRINVGSHSLNGDARSIRNFDTISLNMP